MNRRILIADDSLTVRMDLDEAFTTAGFDTVLCSSLAEIRRALNEETIDLVVLDVTFPDGEGTDLLRELRSDPVTAGIPVILLSTDAQVRDRVRGLDAGAQDFAGKPYDREFVVSRATALTECREAPVDELSTLVLVIDDSLTFRKELRSTLEDAGCRVIEASTGEEGLREAARSRPGVVVVDGLLPDIGGATVIRKIRNDAALRATPCLLLTASSDPKLELEALDAGPDAYIRKELGTDVVLARVAALASSRTLGTTAPGPASLFAPTRVLAIDDSETFLQEIAEALRADGYDVVLARSGEEALELLEVQSVDCILVDLVMPGISGQETCRRIKASPRLREIPVLMLTGTEDRETMVDGIRAGADDYVVKSSAFDVVRARIQAQLRRTRFEAENRLIREELHRKEMEASLEIQRMLEERATELERANRYKSEFLANMSHELRTPLNSMLLISRRLAENREKNLRVEQVTWAETIHQSGKSLLRIIEDLMDLTRLETNRLSLEPEDVTVRELGRTLERRYGCLADEKGLDLVIKVDASAPRTIFTDPHRLTQILNNLVGNALKFTETGEVRVTFSSEPGDDGSSAPSGGELERWLVIRVSDTGIGISPEKQEFVFESFRQEDGTTSRRYGGTGLGLSISKQLAALLGGEIELRSAKGEGSTFSIKLPMSRSRATPRCLPGSADGTPPSAESNLELEADEPVSVDPELSGKRALVVDSDVTELFSLSRVLECAGMDVEIARDRAEGLGRVQGGAAFDVVLTAEQGADEGVSLEETLPDAPILPIAELARGENQDEFVRNLVARVRTELQR